VTPHNKPLPKRYSTRRSSQGTLPLIQEPERYFHQRIHRIKEPPIFEDYLDSPIVEDIQYLFESASVQPTQVIMGDWLVELNRPFNFTNIQGYPHDIPEKTIDKLPTFQGNNVVSTADHWRKFKNMVNKFATNYEDVK
jgi:hypothetical protein